MAIVFGGSDSNEGDADDGMLSEINTTPLVDVMLVLLIIFLITIPVVNAAVSVDLPRQANQLREALTDTVIISVDAQGRTYWHDARVSDREALQERLLKIAALTPQPEVHIRADARADYSHVARVVLACQQAGVVRVGFLTEPPN